MTTCITLFVGIQLCLGLVALLAAMRHSQHDRPDENQLQRVIVRRD